MRWERSEYSPAACSDFYDVTDVGSAPACCIILMQKTGCKRLYLSVHFDPKFLVGSGTRCVAASVVGWPPVSVLTLHAVPVRALVINPLSL